MRLKQSGLKGKSPGTAPGLVGGRRDRFRTQRVSNQVGMPETTAWQWQLSSAEGPEARNLSPFITMSLHRPTVSKPVRPSPNESGFVASF
jgi:hypothetical protein